jgi:AcrR family transcriptional regulator
VDNENKSTDTLTKVSLREEQKNRTRRSIIEASLLHISADHPFSSMSLREIARHAGIAPTSFYRHFSDLNELGLTLVDEGVEKLKEMLLYGKSKLEPTTDLIEFSINIYFDFLEKYPHHFRLLIREKAGNSESFRKAIKKATARFTDEFANFLETEQSKRNIAIHEAQLLTEATVTLAFSVGGEILDEVNPIRRNELKEKLIKQIKLVSNGAWYFKESTLKSDESTDRKH